MTSTPYAAAPASTRSSCVSAPSTSTTQRLTRSGSRRSASSSASATTSPGSRSRLAQTRFATGRGRTTGGLAFLARVLATGDRGLKLCRNSSGLRTNGATV